jgi:isopentenyl-diphosphate delta-isomerase
MLLQQRAIQKYHGGRLWSNTCCSHPTPGESTEEAAQRRLQEEMGFRTPLEKVFDFVYKAEVENGLIEHEYDHVFAGVYEGAIEVNKSEVADYCYEEMDKIKWAINEQPEKFTTWFRIAFPTIEAWWQQEYDKPGIEKN